MHSPLWPILRSFSWQELRQNPWRNLAAVVSVMLGVALALSVHLINASALDEFSQAVRSASGQPDLQLRATAGGGNSVPDTLLARIALHPDVATASPVLELSTVAACGGANARRVPVRVIGVDALTVFTIAPDLMPQLGPDQDRWAVFSPDTVFLNPSARALLTGTQIELQHGLQLRPVRVGGQVRASGSALMVMDIAAAQELFDRLGQLTRIDVKLHPGVDRATFARELQAQSNWPAGLTLAEPADAGARISNLSRAYRVNLTVLAMVALFTGGFLVFSVLALSVARRAQQFALLGVLGLTGRQRLRLVLLEASVLGALGSALGVGLGTALAALALRLLGGDLGGGFFAGSTPALQWSAGAALVFGGLGWCVAIAGAWWPARQAQHLPPAQTLKGLGALPAQGHHARHGALLLAGGAGLALLPPIAGMPLAAYASVALLLVGGITALPWLVGVVLDRVAPQVGHRALAMLAVERARRVRESAAVAVCGVVAALSLAVALTVMVASFRTSVTEWLDTVLPADLYVRAAGAGTSAQETVYFDPNFVQGAGKIAGVARATSQRNVSVQLDPAQPAVTLIARPLGDASGDTPKLPLVGERIKPPPGRVAIYVSEAVRDLYGVQVGEDLPQLYASFSLPGRTEQAQQAIFFIAGIWRDYARQFGTIAMNLDDFQRLSGDTRVNDIALWLDPDSSAQTVQTALKTLAGPQAGELLEFGTAQEIRAMSLKIFDRSFAVTYWLQAVAIGIGLFGVAASFSAQVLARRKEFGLLVHLGLTRRQILQVVAAEGAAWTTMGAIAGLGLGLAVAVVLVHVVNPQSFHWTMELTLPWLRLVLLGSAVVVAGTVTAWLAGQAAANRDAVLAVKEDW
jgi:putative ABC transport system permease protein